MTKLDIVEKIKPLDLVRVLLKKKTRFPYQLIKEELALKADFQPNYFNWGRNAFYYLFKNLKFKKIGLPAFTCPTLVEAARAADKEVVLIETDLETFNLKTDNLSSDLQALVVVHTFGNPVDIKRIREENKNLFIIEDCAHSLFAKINGQYLGKEGEAVLFSFYKQVVNLNGSLLLFKKKLLKKQKQESDWDYLKRLIVKLAGPHQLFLNLKRHQYLPAIEPQGLSADKPSSLVFKLFALGLEKLKKEVEKRKQLADFYYQQVKQRSFLFAQRPTVNSEPSFYHFAVRLDPGLAYLRDKLVFKLRQKNIFLGRLWFNAPVSEKKGKKLHPFCPNSLLLSQSVFNLPIRSSYNREDIQFLFKQIDKTLREVKQ